MLLGSILILDFDGPLHTCTHQTASFIFGLKNSGKFNYGSPPPEQRKLSFLAARERIAAAVGAEEGAEHVAKKSLF